MSSYVEFCLEYYRTHQWMSIEECSKAAQVAWERRHNQPTGDSYQWWMQETYMCLQVERALRNIQK